MSHISYVPPSIPAAVQPAAPTRTVEGLPPSTSTLSVAELRAGLAAVPVGMVAASQRRTRRQLGKIQPLVREGQVVSRAFNISAGRPMPTLVSLEQGIRVTMGYSLAAWLTTSTVATVTAGLAFTLSSFAGATSYLTVFDQYRFDQIEVWLASNRVAVNADIPVLFSAVDLDDAAAPSSTAQVEQKQGAIVTGAEVGHYHKWKPHMAVAAYSGSFTSYANEPAQWVDSGSPNVQHYGLKGGITLSSDPGTTVSLIVRAVVSFRGPGVP